MTNGSTIDVQSYDQKISLFESMDYDWAHFDEPPPRPIYVAVKRGLTDRLGRCWLIMTPLKEAWIHDEVASRDDVGKFNFDIEDNLGYGLTREGIDEYARTLTEDEKEARLRGRFFHLTGLVYKSYDKIHRINRVPIEPEWNLYMHIDTHPRTPHHAVWISVLPNNRKYIVGELVNTDLNNLVKPFCSAVLTYERIVLKYTNNIIRLIEPGASTPNPVEKGLSILDEFIKYGVYATAGSKNRDAGILLFQEELKHIHRPKDGPEIKFDPNIYIYKDLTRIHYELTHYIWDDWAKKAAQGKTEKQVPKDKDDHLIEGIHRILLANPVYFNPMAQNPVFTDYVDEGACH